MNINIEFNSRKDIKVNVPLNLPVLPVEKSIKAFDEIEKGLTEEEASHEAGRCLRCKQAPCVTACPLHVNIPEFISAIHERNFRKAARILLRKNPFPAVCGRICAQEFQCESKCNLNRYGKSVSISALERYVADWMLENPEKGETKICCTPSGKNIAVVGGGPTGLSAAASLVIRGHEVKIYDLLNDTGGSLISEIPEYRLPQKVLIGEIARILSLGVKVECNAPVGQKISFRQLYTKYDAVLLAYDSGSPVSLGIPGERLGGVYSARDYFEHTKPRMREGMQCNQLKNLDARKVVVIGGSNSAIDCSRVAIRLGAEQVRIVYRHRESDMPVRRKEVEQAKEEGVELLELLSPLKIIGDKRGRAKRLVCQAMKPGERDLTGRRKTVPIDGELREIEADLVIYALGSSPNLINTSIIAKDDTYLWENLLRHNDGSTNFPGIFVCDENIRKQGSAVKAFADGQRVAVAIDEYLTISLNHILTGAVVPPMEADTEVL